MTAGLTHTIEDVIDVFNATFAESHNTRLISGSHEPLYLPSSNRCSYHRIVFAHGFYRSALHEIAHWCVAGRVRRHLVDYGYWYKPDGRNGDEQCQFEQVECKPQALELLFCLSAGHDFEVSCDNLAAADPDAVNVAAFDQAVRAQLADYLQTGLPQRAARFATALQQFYRTPEIEVGRLYHAA
ncbi:elongation factor P hydroxylase [Aliidiomarina soli]|uniref:Elongation factor P hydroxylase n=1 Tax=Aliidiomarina soli TaxID=1928574 RepID=A0A432WLE8_9GAMM|nr:elongation factor P hydroxylase [Aliidiomarina soli]RUO34613.1 elongation factor P hydroxylase [Aliidiomarina soli]